MLSNDSRHSRRREADDEGDARCRPDRHRPPPPPDPATAGSPSDEAIIRSSCNDRGATAPARCRPSCPATSSRIAAPSSRLPPSSLSAELERQQEQHESGRGAQDQHRRPRQLHARRQRLAARGRRRVGSQRRARAAAAARPRTPPRTAARCRRASRELPIATCNSGRRHHRHDAGEAGDQAELRVGLDQLAFVAHDRRHERRLRHRDTSSAARAPRRRAGTALCRRRTGSSAAARRCAPRPTACTTNRRPPRTRSITGPMNGATTRNGVKLTSRKASTLLRAPLGSTSKKNESARATTIAASPPIIAACVMASCWNFDRDPAATRDGRHARLITCTSGHHGGNRRASVVVNHHRSCSSPRHGLTIATT